MLFVLFSSNVVAIDLLSGLTNYWRLDNNLIDQVGGNNGTNNGATNISGCIINGCYDFENGESDYVSLDLINPDEVISISAWIYYEDDVSGQPGFFASNVDGHGATDFGFLSSNELHTQSYYDSGWNVFKDPTPVTSFGAWVHMVVLYNGTNSRLYINNSLVASGTLIALGGTYAEGTEYTNIGYYAGTDYWDGKIDELGIWDRVLTSAEVDALYNGGEGFDPTDVPDVPLSITNSSLNMTSEAPDGLGNVSWATDQSVNVFSTAGRPTSAVSTNLNADCSFGTVSENYNSSRACYATGSTSHLCRIKQFDVLSPGISSLYFNCYDGITQYQSGAMGINVSIGTAASGIEFSSCIKTIGSGCGITWTNNCAVIMQ